jgi:hypothetical protein
MQFRVQFLDGGQFEIGDDSGQIVLIMPFEEAIGSA